jgi:hypothetical protein
MTYLYLPIDTRDRASGTPTNCVVPLDIPIIGNVKSISLLSVEMPLAFYTIRTPYNSMSITVDDTDYTVTIKQGNLDIEQVLTEVTTEVESLTGKEFQATYDSTNSKVTLQFTDNTEFTINCSSWCLSRILGFTDGQSGTTITGTNAFNLSYDLYCNLQIDNLTSKYTFKPP